MFSKETLTFLSDLENNNNRDWFHGNKKTYEKFVKSPLKDFTQTMIDEVLGEKAFLNNIQPKDCLFRINRDIRFSKDKSPYKTNLGVVISEGGKKDSTTPGMYIEISHKHLRLYSGCYTLNKEQLLNVRETLFNNTERFLSLANDPKFVNAFGEVRGERNKRIPKPFSEIQDTFPFILNKSFYYFKEYTAETILKESLVKDLITDFEIAKPMNTFLFEALRG